MSIEYKCPHCNGLLNVNDCVLFSVKTPGGKVGLISLHSEIGDYSVMKNPAFEFKEGDILDFFCPICHAELASHVHDQLARVHMIDENNNDFEILFSKIAGEKSTYKIVGETMNIYGDDSAEYLDFINLSMNA
jgi:hypothetical protein